jgi:hypothetical protein
MQPPSTRFLTFRQVLTGQQPFSDIKPLELAYRISCGLRPEKPANAEAIGVSDSLWSLIQKCWDDEKTRRPQIQEVMATLGDSAANWHTNMPPSGTEHRADSISEEDSDELKPCEFSSAPIAPFFSKFLCRDISNPSERQHASY